MTAESRTSIDCAFCAIARGADDSVEVVCQGETWIAFFPLNPATPGHTLVIPRKHVSKLWDVEPPLRDELMSAVIRVGRAIEAGLHPEGMNSRCFSFASMKAGLDRQAADLYSDRMVMASSIQPAMLSLMWS